MTHTIIHNNNSIEKWCRNEHPLFSIRLVGMNPMDIGKLLLE